MKLLRELTEDQPNDSINIVEAVEAACSMLVENKRGGRVNPQGTAKDFFNNNPSLVTGAAALAISAQNKYQVNKRGTFTMHAKNAYERRMVTRIVDAMVSSKEYKIARTKFSGHGKTWVLKKV